MRFLIKKTPDSFLKTVNDEISSILSRHMDGFVPNYMFPEEDRLTMPVELKEKDTEYLVRAELPGIKKEDLDIDMDKDSITIRAKKEDSTEDEGKYYKHSEFNYGEFSRTICFPQEIEINKANASLNDGVLKIEIPKKESEKESRKKLTVN